MSRCRELVMKRFSTYLVLALWSLVAYWLLVPDPLCEWMILRFQETFLNVVSITSRSPHVALSDLRWLQLVWLCSTVLSFSRGFAISFISAGKRRMRMLIVPSIWLVIVLGIGAALANVLFENYFTYALTNLIIYAGLWVWPLPSEKSEREPPACHG